MLDPVLYQILEIIFLTQDSWPSQDLIPDLDLGISTNQLNVIIATKWVTLQTIVSDIRIETFLEDNLIKVGEIISEILDGTQITELILETEMTMVVSTELIPQILLCIQIYRQGIINRHRFGGSHFQRNLRSYRGFFSDTYR